MKLLMSLITIYTYKKYYLEKYWFSFVRDTSVSIVWFFSKILSLSFLEDRITHITERNLKERE